MKKWENRSVPQRIPEKYKQEILKYAKFLDELDKEKNSNFFFSKKENLYLFNTKIKIIDNIGFVSLRDLNKKFKLLPIELHRLL